jgi:hypothetical protein
MCYAIAGRQRTLVGEDFLRVPRFPKNTGTM